jgi:hypothetical protein
VLREAVLLNHVDDVQLNECLEAEAFQDACSSVGTPSQIFLDHALSYNFQVLLEEFARLVIKESGQLGDDLADGLSDQLRGGVE